MFIENNDNVRWIETFHRWEQAQPWDLPNDNVDFYSLKDNLIFQGNIPLRIYS